MSAQDATAKRPVQTPSPRRLLRKRYAVALGAMLLSVALGRTGTLCLPLGTDGTQLCVALHVVHVAQAAAALPECTEELDGSNALDASGHAVVCSPPYGWLSELPDGGEL